MRSLNHSEKNQIPGLVSFWSLTIAPHHLGSFPMRCSTSKTPSEVNRSLQGVQHLVGPLSSLLSCTNRSASLPSCRMLFITTRLFCFPQTKRKQAVSLDIFQDEKKTVVRQRTKVKSPWKRKQSETFILQDLLSLIASCPCLLTCRRAHYSQCSSICESLPVLHM